ncbi:dTMP kinase [bacterium]|nr:dTMP kinase [bacterium]
MFICFEGIDGSGKTTQARMLCARLQKLGREAECVADPGTTALGVVLRGLILDNDDPISPSAQMLLFSAARAELADYIRSRLAQKIIVICDRWLLSTLVYQNQSPADLILSIFNNCVNLPADECFLLDVDHDVAALRRGEPTDRYERLNDEDRSKMRQNYLHWAYNQLNAKTTHIISADTSPDIVHERIFNTVVESLGIRA